MLSLNRYRLKHLAKEGHSGAKRVTRLLDRPDRLLGTILVGNNVVNILAASIATVLAAGCTAQRTAELLVAASLEGGGHDNTTAVVVDALQVPDLPPTAHPSRPGGASSQGAQ